MDSTDREGTANAGSDPASTAQEQRSPLLIRGLVFALLLVVLVSIYSEGLFQTQPEGPAYKASLQKLGLAYHEYRRVMNQSPASLDQLQDFLENPPPPPKAEGIVGAEPVAAIILPPLIINQIREGSLVVRWSAVLTNSGQENDQYLLAYPSDIEEFGGFALTAAGRAVELTPEAFKEFPLVQIKVSEVEQPETKEAAPEKTESAETKAAETQAPPAEKQ